jgi:cell division protein ZapB
LRSDNHDLRQQLATALNDNKQLATKIGVASTRLESLLTQIPDEQS